MENFGSAKTVEDLIKVLSTLPPECEWYGWDDGCIIIVDPITKNELGFIENKE